MYQSRWKIGNSVENVIQKLDNCNVLFNKKLTPLTLSGLGYFCLLYSKTLNNEYIERIDQMSYSSLSGNIADI